MQPSTGPGLYDLDRSIIATLSYYGTMQWPLAPLEVHERLIPASRLGGSGGRPHAGEVYGRLAILAQQGTIVSRYGMYATTDLSPAAWATRVEREKETAAKWRRMRRYAWWLQAVPYTRALLASGSLASGQAAEASDWDMFVVAQSGHLYTARTFLLAISWLMGRLRTKRHAVAPDRFCFNHYVTTDGLVLRHRGIFMAHAQNALIAIHDPEGYLGRLWRANEWTAEYIASQGPSSYVRREVSPSEILMLIGRLSEMVLDTWMGRAFESVLRTWQQRRIMAEPATHEPGGRIVANEYELEFHPHSFERTVVDRYNRALERMGCAGFSETDSGLNVDTTQVKRTIQYPKGQFVNK